MPRPIDADSLLDKVLRHYTEQEKKGNLSFVACEIKQFFADMVNEAPTIEPPRWIHVSEQLPEPDVYVLVIAYGKPAKNVTLRGAVELAEYDPEGWILEMWPEWTDANVTHWTPLPEAPKED